MNNGEIVQDGDAVSLYTQPANLFAAQAQQLTGEHFTGQVALRPESIKLGTPEQGIAGKILNHSLLGNVVLRYRIVVNGVELAVDVLNRAPGDLLRAGSTIGVHITTDALREVA
ncbi:MAG: TOBE domain-containing protein [Symbiopectobacterium sp.]|uniref:TOBE domain-containing protein n=1 Tax=Symbiopectobacterium sp. TaxID=2952789 RepID=UPI003F3A250D